MLGSEDAGRNRYIQTLQAGALITVRDQVASDLLVLCTGWAYRYMQLSDGRRQILRFLLPGDVISLATIVEKSDPCWVRALTDVVLSGFSRSVVRESLASGSGVLSAVVSASVAEMQDASELATMLGKCSAEERIAYLLLRLMSGIAARNVIREHRYPFPLRQQHIADAVGLTTVHVSRVFGLLRERGTLTMSEGVLTVFDVPELERLGSLR